MDSRCDICDLTVLNGIIIDGKTILGPWAMMCVKCHELYGEGFGVGRGQRYQVTTGKVESVPLFGGRT